MRVTRIGGLVDRVRKKFAATPSLGADAEDRRNERKRAAIRLMFAGLKRASDARGERLVLLYQPVIYEIDTSRLDPWTKFLEETAREQQITFVNVLDHIRSRNDSESLFIQAGTAAGHYSDAGHAIVADALYKRISNMLPAR